MNCLRLPSVRKLLSAALLLSLACVNSPAIARDEDDKPEPIFSLGKRPFVVITAASPNRLKEKASFMFELAGTPDAVDAILDQLDKNLNGLQGLNWDRPVGMMVFLDSVFPPAFEFVAFLPMSSPEEFQSMMELGPVIMRPDPVEEGRYELIGARQNTQIRTQGDYAFIQLPMMDPDPAFERDLPDPSTLVAGLVNQFDVGVMLDVEAVPKGTRDLILNVLTSTMSTQMQQRDGESESLYAMRKSWMQGDIDGIKLLFDECRKMSIGVRLTPDEPGANFDFVMDVRDGSKMLEEILASGTKPSYFTPLLSEESPVSLSMSSVIAERDRVRYEGALEGLKGFLPQLIEEQDLGSIPDESSPLIHAISALQATFKEGHLDFFSQMYRDSDDKLVVVGAARVEDGEDIAAGLLDALQRLDGKDGIGKIETGNNEHAGITFHRLEFDKPDAGATELFGASPGVSVGVGGRSAWICLGGEESFDVLTNVMDELAAAHENPTEREIPASFRVVVHVNELKDLIQGAQSANRDVAAAKEAAAKEASQAALAEAAKGGKPSDQNANGGDERRRATSEFRQRRAARRQELFGTIGEAIAEGDDLIQVDARPTDKGVRLRTRLDAGFVRGVGRFIASQFAEK